MTKLTNGCSSTRNGRLVKQNQFPNLPEELEILTPTIMSHRGFIVVAYLPCNEGKCKKLVYTTSGDHGIHVEFHSSLDSVRPYQRTVYAPKDLPQRHIAVGREMLQAYQYLLRQYIS